MWKPLQFLKDLFSPAPAATMPAAQEESQGETYKPKDPNNLKQIYKDLRNTLTDIALLILDMPEDDLSLIGKASASFLTILKEQTMDYADKYTGAIRKNRKNILRDGMEQIPPNKLREIFKRMDSVGYLDEMLKFSEENKGQLPPHLVRSAKRWKKENGGESVARSGPQTPKPSFIPTEEFAQAAEQQEFAAPEETQDNTLRIVEVDDLLPSGEAEEPESLELLKKSGHADASDNEIRTQPRLEWILDALKEQGFENKDLVLYREKYVEGSSKTRSQYQVLEAQKDDAHFQIAVSKIVGESTYVIRRPIDFCHGVVVEVSDLKQDPDVFKISCYTQTQWLRNINYYAYTPLDDLNVQIKTRLFWGDKKDAVLASFGEFYLETMQVPNVNDTSIIEYGPLAGKTTMRRMYAALNNEHIRGLEDVKNFRQLRDHIFGPGAEACNNRVDAGVIEARDIFHFAALDIMQTGKVTIDPAVDLSFRRNKVRDIGEIVSSETKIMSAKDFYLASGLAEKSKGGKLVPASDANLRDYIELMDDQPRLQRN